MRGDRIPLPEPDFAARLIAWQRTHGRHGLPWQDTRDSYRIWVSEIMLQQTQVSTVLGYYERFLARFPDVASLAAAAEDAVLAEWSGLGYYSRARNLHAAARQIVEVHAGVFPKAPEAIAQLPGIGRSTAAAIAAFAYGARAAILDGNVKRVLARHYAVPGFPGATAVEKRLWALAESLLPEGDLGPYTQGLMDLGATVCLRSRPLCDACPVRATCAALAADQVEQYPQPRPVKAIPERQTVMLMVRSGPEIFLEKRPATGVWGGMWSFPEISTGDDPVEACRARFGAEAATEAAWATFTHTFSHFRLVVTPQPVMVERSFRAEERGGVWLTVEDALRAAIPKPVRELLKKLA